MRDYAAVARSLPSPCYLIDRDLLRKNLELLHRVEERTGCHILLAQKAFSMYSLYPMIGEYLSGTTASSLFEARLGREEMGGQTHIYSPAYREDEFEQIAALCDHIVFNSFEQLERFYPLVQESPRRPECGIRVNPEYSEIGTALYNPCAPNSRMGITLEHFEQGDQSKISGIHFHTMCEQGADTLERTLSAVEARFGPYLHRLQWINFGGGHHITRPDYDVEKLIACIDRIRDRYGVQVYLEPGEGVVLNTGFLCCTVLDTMKNGMDIALVDTSAACHMPDVLEMPYRPEIIGAGKPGEKPYTYRLGAPTCLAGDVIGDYSFDRPLKSGDRLVFCDMALYTMVKNNTFNGINLPAIAVCDGSGAQVVRTFGYEDFKSRL